MEESSPGSGLMLPRDLLFALNGAVAVVVTAAAITVSGCASLDSSYATHFQGTEVDNHSLEPRKCLVLS